MVGLTNINVYRRDNPVFRALMEHPINKRGGLLRSYFDPLREAPILRRPLLTPFLTLRDKPNLNKQIIMQSSWNHHANHEIDRTILT